MDGEEEYQKVRLAEERTGMEKREGNKRQKSKRKKNTCDEIYQRKERG